jgi:3'-5' exonuclease
MMESTMLATPTLVFDIETIPDAAGLRAVSELPPDLGDEEVVQWALQQRRAAVGHDFLPLHLHRVVALSCVLSVPHQPLRIFSLAEPTCNEPTILQRFFDGIEKYTPQIVTWNGGGFDLPVLHYRSLIHRVKAPRYWNQGEGHYPDSRDFKWNNYISRYHARHLDLMDLLALYQPRANAPLDELAKLMGFPGKLGMDGSKVWEAWQAGKAQEIQDYCETDVANTWLVYLGFEHMRGNLDADALAYEHARLRHVVGAHGGPHWAEFLQAWPNSSP